MATYRHVRSTRLLVFALLLASLVTITVDSRAGRSGPLAAMGRLGTGIVTPLQEGVATVFRPIGSFFSNLFRAGSLAEQNAALRQRIADLLRERQEILTYQRENQELRDAVGLRDRLGFQTIGATVTGEVPSNFEWGVFIDRGSNDRVTLDSPVISRDGLVGRVVAVTPTSAKVMLIIDPRSSVAARLSASGERALLVGRREEDLLLDLVDPETEIRPGETVETSGYQLESGVRGLFPPGIPVGVVSEVEPGQLGGHPRVLVRPNVDFSRLDYVLVVEGIPSLTREEPALAGEPPDGDEGTG